MKALVTGVAGFIGSHLAEELIGAGDNVVGIDCFTPYYSPRLKMENLSDLLSTDRFRLAKQDVLEADWGELLRRSDIVFHLAAQPGVRSSWSMFDQYVRNNLLATQVVLEECSKRKKNLVFASSSSVYGDSESYPTKEDSLLSPVSPYGVTKQAAERLCSLYGRSGSAKIIVLRYFSVFGPRQRPDMGIHRFIERALKGLPLTIYGDGSQERDYTFVSDIVSGTMAASEKGVWGETINLGGGRATKLRDIVGLVLERTGSRSRVRHEPTQRGDAERTMADISKARKLLGYSAEVDLRTGIGRQIEWQTKRGKA